MPDKQYRYNVIVENTVKSDSRGTQKAKEDIRSWEQEQIDSMKRVASFEDKNIRARNDRIRSGWKQASADLERYETQLDRINKKGVNANKLERGIARGDYFGVSEQKLTQLRQKANELDKAIVKNQSSLNQWGQAFKGAFIGAVAGLSFSLIIGGIFGITRGIANLGIEAVKAGARFETTTNALSVFAGGVQLARRELADIDTVARSTAGLRLETAEVGFTRLRALGFEAEQARAFIKELGEEKILSGASNEALDRIIFNFAQIASGGQKVSQELREILTQMPSLRNGIRDAFGTLDPQKIQQFFDKDTDDAFKRLTDAMARQKAASGGLEDAWGKMSDAWIQTGRSFSEPFIPQLTDDIKDLTQYLYDNQSTFVEWGNTVSEILRGVSGIVRSDEFQGLLSLLSSANDLNFDIISGGTYRPIKTLLEKRRLAKAGAEQPKKEAELAEEYNNKALLDIERFAEKELRADEMKRRKQLEQASSYYSLIESMRESAFRVEEAQVADNAEKVFAIRQRNFAEEIKEIRDFYNQKINLSAGNDDEVVKLMNERDVKIRKLQTESEVARINFEREQENRRRENLKEANSQLIQLTELYFDKILKNADLLENGREKIEQYYDNLINLTKSKYELLLQNEQLNQQERINLNQQYNIEVTEIRQKELDTIEEFEDKKRQRFVETLEFQRKVASETLQFYAQFANDFQSQFFNPNTFNSSQFNLFRQIVLKSGSFNELRREQEYWFNETERRDKALASYNSQFDAKWLENPDNYKKYSEGFDVIAKTRDSALANWQTYTDQIKELEDTIPKIYFEFEQLADQISTGNVKAFDELNKKILEYRQRLERSDAEGDVEYFQTLEKFYADAATQTEDAGRRQEYLDKVRDYGFERQKAQRRLERLDYDQAIAKAEQYRNSLEGITKEIELLRSGDEKALAGILYQFQSGQLQQTRDLIKEIYTAEYELASPDITAEYRTRLEILRYMIDLRNEEADTITRIYKAQIDLNRQFEYSPNRERANVAEFIASQRGITEVISDAKINAIKGAYDGLDKVAQSLAKNFGLAADAVQDLISGLLRLGLNWIFRKLFGGQGGFGFGGQQQSGFGFGGLNLGGFGGGGFPIGIGGTAPFNPTTIGNFNGTGLTFGGLGNGGLNIQTLGGLQPENQTRLLGAGSSASSSLGGLGSLSSLFSQVGPAALSTVAIGLFLDSLTTTNPVKGALQGGLVGFLFSIFNRTKLRRKEERIRDKAMVDALAALDKLIDQVNNDQIDGAAALTQADQIRQNYVDQMSQLTDKKTRNIALKDVSRIDSKIEELKAAVSQQTSRKDRLDLLVPTFYDGGSLSGFSRNNFANNPLGYQSGGQQVGYFPSANRFASFNERGSEYILDAETTRNIGVSQLDLMRATKGQSFNAMLNRGMLSRETGGTLSGGNTSLTNLSNLDLSKVTLNVQLHVTLGMETMVEVMQAMISSNNGSTEQLRTITAELKKSGDNEFLQLIQRYLQGRKG